MPFCCPFPGVLKIRRKKKSIKNSGKSPVKSSGERHYQKPEITPIPPLFQERIDTAMKECQTSSLKIYRVSYENRILRALKSFSLDEFREIQQKALKEIVLGKDVLVILPILARANLLFFKQRH
ncbi:hypothetical protein AC249_AIPGENE13200 [Exaiptasia diaphana]|nr:hypothetical protein AC249_AIPGENE13200 [Exaiptasia diaphana]